MSGSLREKRKGVWEVRVEVGRDPVTGRRRQLSRSVQGGKRSAQKVLDQLAAEAGTGTHVGTDATFAVLADRWLPLTARDLSPTTVRRYQGLLRRHILPALGSRRVSDIRPVHLDDLYSGLLDRSGLSPASVRQVHAVIRREMRQAVRWGWIASNPAANATPPRVPKPSLSPPSVEQLADLLAEAHRRDPELGRVTRRKPWDVDPIEQYRQSMAARTPEESFRPLTADERRLLEAFVAQNFPGAEALRHQLNRVEARRGCGCGCGTLDLLVPDSDAAADGDGIPHPVEVEGLVSDDEGGDAAGLLLFVRDGQLAKLEIYSMTNDPQPLPDPSQVSWVRPRSGGLA